MLTGTFTQEFLLHQWRRLNVRYFRNRLPAISIVWSSRLTASMGLFYSRIGPRSHGVAASSADRRAIRLSLPLFQKLLTSTPDAGMELVGTLAHEMIHQWQYDILKRRPNHGGEFHRMMARMNGDGLGVTVYHSLTKEVDSFARYAWRCRRCGLQYRRQRRTIRPGRHQCGVCRGRLVEVASSAPLATWALDRAPNAGMDNPAPPVQLALYAHDV